MSQDGSSISNDEITAGLGSDGRSISLVVGATALNLNRFWLRDLCPDLPAKETGMRTFSVASLPADLAATSARAAGPERRLIIEWNDGHRCEFSVEELLARADHVNGVRQPLAPLRYLDATGQPSRFAMPDVADGSLAHHHLLQAVVTDGVALVEDVPDDDGATLALADLLGRVRENDFGRVFDIVPEPEAWTLSQSNQGQDPHSDDPYRYYPNGITVLHCRRAASGDGGSSILVDGFKVADDLRRNDPDGFELLRSIPIPFVRRRSAAVDQGDDVHLVAYAPVISTDEDGEIMGVRFHERSIGVFDLAPDVVDRYYLAFRSFAERVRSPHYQFVHRLADGQAFVLDNQRMLHGRTDYASDNAGRRHLRLCSVDRDQVHSRLRRLKETHKLDGVDDRFRSGAVPG